MKDLKIWGKKKLIKILGKFEKEVNRRYRYENIVFEIKNWMDKLNID